MKEFSKYVGLDVHKETFVLVHLRNSLSCAWRLTIGSFAEGLQYMSNFYYCLPGRAGGPPLVG